MSNTVACITDRLRWTKLFTIRKLYIFVSWLPFHHVVWCKWLHHAAHPASTPRKTLPSVQFVRMVQTKNLEFTIRLTLSEHNTVSCFEPLCWCFVLRNDAIYQYNVYASAYHIFRWWISSPSVTNGTDRQHFSGLPWPDTSFSRRFTDRHIIFSDGESAVHPLRMVRIDVQSFHP
jgi:hypothetical protein